MSDNRSIHTFTKANRYQIAKIRERESFGERVCQTNQSISSIILDEGLEATRRIMQQYKTCVVMRGGNAISMNMAKESGGAGFTYKPIVSTDMMDTLDEVLHEFHNCTP